MKAHGMRRMAGRVTAAVREMNEAQRRMTALRMGGSRHLIDPGAAPATYDEFLMRTSGPLTHEPPAADRRPRP